MVSAFGLYVGYQSTLDSLGQWRDYYARRFFRIAPLFYFMMVFYLPYLWVMFDGSTISPAKFLSSLLFVFNLIPAHSEGFVWALWSIGVEMIFYLLLPVITVGVRGVISASVFLLLALFVQYQWVQSFVDLTDNAVLGSFKTYFILAHIHYFAAGIFAYFLWQKLSKILISSLVGTILTGAAFFGIVFFMVTALPMEVINSFISDTKIASYIYSVSFAFCFALLLVGFSLSPISFLVNRLTCSLGKTSFSLYLWHPVVIYSLFRANIYDHLYNKIDNLYAAFFLSACLTLGILIPLAYVSYRIIEVSGMKLAQRFRWC